MTTIPLSKTYSIWFNDPTPREFGSVEVDQRGEVIWLGVENPGADDTYFMDVLLTPDEARQLATELTRLADLLDSNSADT